MLWYIFTGTTCQCICPSERNPLNITEQSKGDLLQIYATVTAELNQAVRVNTSQLSRNWRLRNSASDNRTSSKEMGAVAACVLSFILVLIALIDVVNVRMCMRQICQYESLSLLRPPVH